MKFALFLIISCALVVLVVRVAEEVPGDENTNNEDFHGSSRGDKPFFIKKINKWNKVSSLSLCTDYRKMSCVCLQRNPHPVNAASPNESVIQAQRKTSTNRILSHILCNEF